jgi:hypothetical protein
MLVHNLACLNFVEMLEYNENPPSQQLDELSEQLQKAETQRLS